MDTTFPDLYGIVNLKPTADTLDSRWKAVSTLAKSEAADPTLALVRISANRDADSAVVVAAARTTDPAFQTRNSTAEVRVLATAALCEMFKKPSPTGDVAALATMASTLNGTRGDELTLHAASAAKEYVNHNSIRVRVPHTTSTSLSKRQRTDGIQIYQTAATPHAGSVGAAGDAIAALVELVTAPHVTAINSLQHQLEALREESNMCWWTFAGRSRYLDKHFDAIGAPAAGLVAARELAEMTALLPGPRSAIAFLGRVLSDTGSDNETFSIADAVNRTPRDWRAAWSHEFGQLTGMADILPMLVAVHYSLGTESESDWVSSFVKATNIRDARFTQLELAAQAYVETLTVRAVRRLSE